MTRDEIKKRSFESEIAKLEKQRERKIAILRKKTAAAEKLGANLSAEEFRARHDTLTEKQDAVCFALLLAKDDLEETESRIARLKKSLSKVDRRVTVCVEQRTQEEIEKEKAAAIEEWARDGITVELISSNLIRGRTPKGKYFTIDGNNGFTDRSRHCFTLSIVGKMIFSSGEFYRAYSVIKHS